MKNLLFPCLLIIAFFHCNAQIVSVNKNEINSLKSKIANDQETKEIFSVFEKTAKQYLNESPKPLDTIRSEGLLKGNPMKERTILSLPDFNKMFALALQYRLSLDQKYLQKATNFLTSWAKKNISIGDPIDDTKLDAAFEAFDLIKDEMSISDRKLVEGWLKQIANAEMSSKFMLPYKTTAKNNWNAHRIKIVGAIGFLINDQQLINWAIENLKKHISINLYADGTSLDFKERDAMHYHIYDLEPMLRFIKMVKRSTGENLYAYQAPSGSSIKKSVDWLLPYLKGEKQHEEYVNSTVKFDRLRAKNNEPGFKKGTMFTPEMALPVFDFAIYFDPSLMDIVKSVDRKPKDWKTIINEITTQK